MILTRMWRRSALGIALFSAALLTASLAAGNTASIAISRKTA